MNVAGSQRVGSSLEHLGYTFTDKAEDADVIVLNTCVVRQSAEDKALGRLSFTTRIEDLADCDVVIEADIETANVEVSGQVTGNIAASDKVELKADCKVVGDIRAPRILIADGAVFKGNVDMDVKEAKGK